MSTITSYIARSGMQNSQKKLDVIANNITNANTNGFKRQYATFRTTVNELGANAEAVYNKILPGDNGSALASVRRDLSEGPIVNTGNLTDYALTGPGYFSITDENGDILLTRNGSFRYNTDGVLVDLNGRTVNIDETLGTDIAEQFVLYHVDERDIESQGDNYFILVDDADFITSQDDATIFYRPVQGAIENSNVDLGLEMTEMIVSHRSYSMSSKVFEVSDEIADMINNVDR